MCSIADTVAESEVNTIAISRSLSKQSAFPETGDPTGTGEMFPIRATLRGSCQKKAVFVPSRRPILLF